MERAAAINRTRYVIDHVSKNNNTCVLFFSATGKDSIVLFHLIQSRFQKVICLFLYMVEGLSFVETYLNWAKSFNNVEIVQMPHPDLLANKASGQYNTKAIKDMKNNISHTDIKNLICRKYATDIVFMGQKVSDSYVRRGMYHDASKHEFHFQNGVYYPLINWKNKDCYDYIKLNRLPQPLKLGSKHTGSGISLRKECVLRN